jgi:5-methylcytosine-specific restriction endonuclease McrA
MATLDLTNKVFGKWSVLELIGHDIHGKVLWKCKCECGTIKNQYSYTLTSGGTKSCGCLKYELIKPYEAVYNSLKRAAKLRKITCDITYEEFLNYVKTGKCFYCLEPVMYAKYRKNNKKQPYSGYYLDRKNSSLGYTKKNCVVCCQRCNKGKSNLFNFSEWYGMTEYLRLCKGTNVTN